MNKCSRCNGAGTVIKSRWFDGWLFRDTRTCPACKGRGRSNKVDGKCNSLSMSLPPKMPDESKVEFHDYKEPMFRRIIRFIKKEGYQWCDSLGCRYGMSFMLDDTIYCKGDSGHVGIMVTRPPKYEGWFIFKTKVSQNLYVGSIRFNKSVWRFNIMGIEYVEEMNELAEKLSKKFDVYIKVRVTSKHPKRELFFDDGGS